MRRFDRVAGLVSALHRCIRTASDVSDARAWYVREALTRYARLVVRR